MCFSNEKGKELHLYISLEGYKMYPVSLVVVVGSLFPMFGNCCFSTSVRQRLLFEKKLDLLRQDDEVPVRKLSSERGV